MRRSGPIPVFNLFGETADFPDVAHCERIRDRAALHDWEIAPHRHREMLQVLLIRHGFAEAWLDRRRLELQDGDFLYVPGRIVHGFRFRKGSDGHVFSFPAPLASPLRGASAAMAARLDEPFKGRTSAALNALTDVFIEAFSGGEDSFRAPLLAAMAQGVLGMICRIDGRDREKPPPQSPSRRMEAFEALIMGSLSEPRRVQDFAEALRVTPGHLNRICQTAAGCGAQRFIEVRRMTEACRLLAFTRLSVAEVGYRLGFADPSYFSRRFRAVQGLTPSAYRLRFDL